MTKRVFRVFTMQRYNIAKAHFGLGLVSVGISWYKLVSVGLGGFRWVSAFIIYVYILYLYEERPVPAKGLKCQKSKLT